MSPPPSFTLDVETATAVRDWLFETGVKNHAEPQIADPLAELAAAIDGELHDSTEYVAITASTTAFPPNEPKRTLPLVTIRVEEIPLLAHQFSNAVFEYPLAE
jgi:hypothetical protein